MKLQEKSGGVAAPFPVFGMLATFANITNNNVLNVLFFRAKSKGGTLQFFYKISRKIGGRYSYFR